MAPSLKVLALCCAILGAVDAAAPMSLRLANRKVAAKHAEHELSITQDTQGDMTEAGGKATLLIIPANATGDDILVKVAAVVEHIGPNDDDMWIRRVQVNGQWLKQKWAFKTGSGFFGDPSLYQARLGDGPWLQPLDLLKASDGLLRLAIHNKEPPTRLFQSSVGQEIHLVIGPVTLGVKYTTSNKDGRNFNHLDVHLAGLTDVVQSIGGVLMGDEDSYQAPPHMAFNGMTTDIHDVQGEDEE